MYCALLKTVFTSNLSVILINPFIAMQRRIVITYIFLFANLRLRPLFKSLKISSLQLMRSIKSFYKQLFVLNLVAQF